MPNIAQAFKEEINRLARRTIRANCNPLRKDIVVLKKTVREQQQAIAKLAKELERLKASSAPGKIAPSSVPQAQTRVRLSPASIKKHRQRLKLSQRELGKLLEVSTNTVVRWETGASRPRAAHRAELARLRAMGVREVKKLLTPETESSAA
jgi:DNA-binding transcriptional regulator YiaG